jgi:hypothetical protein
MVNNNILEEMAFCELLISCQWDECGTIFQSSIDEPATDPVEIWAANMAQRAAESGWIADGSGRVLCPNHSH